MSNSVDKLLKLQIRLEHKLPKISNRLESVPKVIYERRHFG